MVRSAFRVAPWFASALLACSGSPSGHADGGSQVDAVTTADGTPDQDASPNSDATPSSDAPPLSCEPTAGTVSAADFGAIGDGVTDDTDAIQRAADQARDDHLTLIIPAGDYLISANLNLYTNVQCCGTLVIHNDASVPSVVIARTAPGTTIPANTLSGLTRGSTKITGLNGFENGTVVLKSTEVLTRRWQGTTESPAYTKNETSKVTSADGDVSPPLDNTYTDLSALAVTVYPYEEPITINGLKVQMVGTTINYGWIVRNRRSNVTFNDISIINPSTDGSPELALSVLECDGTTINRPVISGFGGSGGDKYGICLSIDSHTTITDGNIRDPGHAVTGRHSKVTVVRGGYYNAFKSAIDTHWGNGFLVENASLDGLMGVSFAGTDLTIRNCTVANAVQILSNRNDTPDIMGVILVEDVVLTNPVYDWGTFVYRATYNGTTSLDFGHPLQGPDSMTLRNIAITLPAAGWDAWYGQIFSGYQYLYEGKITTENIVLADDVGTLHPSFDYGQ